MEQLHNHNKMTYENICRMYDEGIQRVAVVQVEETESTINDIDQRYLQTIQELQEKKQDLYNADGEIYEQYVTLGDRIDDAVSKWSVYSNANDYKTQLINNLTGKGISEKDIDYIISSLSEDEIKQAATLEIAAYIDKDVTVDKVKEAIALAQKEAEIQIEVKELDPAEFLKSHDDKTDTATLADLQEEADLLSSISEELYKTGKIGASSMQSIIEKYPEAKEYLGDYMLGLLSEAELFEKLQEVYHQDEENYKRSLLSKAQADGTFYQNLVSNNQEFFTELSNAYGQDFSNYKNLAQAKAEIDKQLVQELSGIWGAYYNVMLNEATGLYELTSQATTADQDMDLGLYQSVTGDLEVNKVSKLEQIRDHLNSLQNIGLNQISIGFDTSWQGLSNFDPADFDSSGSNDSENDTSKDYDLIERAIQKLEREISNLDSIVDDTFSTWSTRNSALLSQINKVNEEIDTQKAAYESYMSLADSVGLDPYYQDLIKNGSIEVITITDESLQEQIDTFQIWYDKAVECSSVIDSLQDDIRKLGKERFDNIVSQFEEIQESIAHSVKMLNSYINLAESSGYFATEEIYNKLIAYNQKNLTSLYAEQDSLNNKLQQSVSSGLIQEESTAWHEMQAQINNVNESIIDTIVSIKNFATEIQNLNFEKFDWLEDKINELTAESDFYINLISVMNKDLHDENGKLTDEGYTTVGLHAQNFNTYLQQANDYAAKIDEINNMLKDDPTNKILLEQKQAYIEAQRDFIISAQDEHNAITDLIKDGYDKQLDSLSSIIDKYKELMNTMKDAYDYEKNINEQIKNINSLNKQLMAYQGDNSEETKKTIQQLKEQINTAEEELKETEYEKLISDTEKLLDDLQTEYEELINQRLDNIDGELLNITNAVSDSANVISNVLKELSYDNSLPLTDAMLNIWDDAKPVVDLNTSVSSVNQVLSGTNEAIQGIRDDIQNIIAKMGTQIESEISNIKDDSYNTDDFNSNSTYTPSEPSYEDNSSYDYSSDENNSAISDDWAIYKYYYPQELNTDTSIVDRLKANNIDASFEARKQYYSKMGGEGVYNGTYDQNVWMLDWMKSHGYQKGTRSATDGWHLVDEDGLGSELIITKHGALRQLDSGDHVFNKEMTENLWKIAANPPQFILPDIKPVNIPEIVPKSPANNISYECGQINVNLPNVKNYEDFCKKAQRDPKFERMVQAMTADQMLGMNSLNKLQF